MLSHSMGVTKHPLFVDLSGLASVPVDDALVVRLQASWAELAPDAARLVEHFYALLFEAHPRLRPLFPDDMEAQREKLAASLWMVITGLSAPLTVNERLRELGRDHVEFGAQAEDYPLVCEALVGAMAEVAGSRWTAELDADWRLAVRQVSAIMIAGTRG